MLVVKEGEAKAAKKAGEATAKKDVEAGEKDNCGLKKSYYSLKSQYTIVVFKTFYLILISKNLFIATGGGSIGRGGGVEGRGS